MPLELSEVANKVANRIKSCQSFDWQLYFFYLVTFDFVP